MPWPKSIQGARKAVEIALKLIGVMGPTGTIIGSIATTLYVMAVYSVPWRFAGSGTPWGLDC